MIKKAFMAATVLLLLLLVLITPRLIGYREDISSLPRLVINYSEDQLVIHVTSLSGTYLYDHLFLNVTPLDGPGPTVRHQRVSYSLQERVSLNRTTYFLVEAAAVDRRGTTFDIGVEVTAIREKEGWSFRLRILPDEAPRTMTEDDLVNAPFATLMERREVEE